MAWWQKEMGAAGTGEAGGRRWSNQGSLSQCGMALFQLFTLESNDGGAGAVLHSLGEILVDLRGPVVTHRASSPFSARNGGAAASPAVCPWMGRSHPSVPQFPCLESKVEGTVPSLAGTGRHKQGLPVPMLG